MRLWKDRQFSEDSWTIVADDQPVAPEGEAIVSLGRWRAERATLSTRNAPLGLLLQPGDDWRDVVSDLSRFPVIAVAFPKMADGRGFSYARLLRDRDGFAGEIRAVGAFTLDQMPLMRRVGINAFEAVDEMVRKGLARGVWPEVPFYYQPEDSGREVPAGTRPWARKPAK